jgi:hypothetical protein
MNFISAFNELEKLYEETTPKVALKKADDLYSVVNTDGQGNEQQVFAGTEEECQKKLDSIKRSSPKSLADRFSIKQGAEVPVVKEACVKESDDKTNSTEQGVMKNKDINTVSFGATQEPESSDCTKTLPATNKLEEAAEEEVPADEEVDIEVVDDEARQIVIECDKCGALVIIDEADIVVDEESDLVNVKDECKFCEEAAGYKIVGSMIPYEPIDSEDVEDDVPGEELPEEDEELDEFLDIKPSVSLNLDGGQGNDVSVLGR